MILQRTMSLWLVGLLGKWGAGFGAVRGRASLGAGVAPTLTVIEGYGLSGSSLACGLQKGNTIGFLPRKATWFFFLFFSFFFFFLWG